MIAPPIHPAVPQLHQLTGLRGIAAWLVVLYHARLAATELFPPEIIAVFARGYLAVDLFFMLSGFVMWLNYGERLRAEGWGGAPSFWWKRIARIWPLHIAILAVMVAFVAVLLATGRATDGYPIAELPLHILLLQNWGFTATLSWNHPAWSISTELAAYIVFPALVLAARWERMRLPALIAALAGLLAVLHLLYTAAGHRDLGEDIAALGLWRCLIEFTVGMFVALIWQGLRGRTGPIVPALAALAILAAAAIFALPETAIAPAVFAAGLLALALSGGAVSRLLASRALRWLGDISYATYLIHFFGFILFKIAFVDDDGQLTGAQLTFFLFLVLGASAAAFRLLEKPAQRWMLMRRPRIFGGTPARASN